MGIKKNAKLASVQTVGKCGYEQKQFLRVATVLGEATLKLLYVRLQ